MKRRDDGIDVQGKAPSFQFYPADHERDMATLGLAEQGLWMRMLCKMHWAKRRGYLEHPSGVPISIEELATLVGQPTEVVRKTVAELDRIGVFSREHSGVIFSRRMAHDAEISSKRRQAGRLGGNPDLVKQMDLVKQNDLLKQNGLDNQNADLVKQNADLDKQTNSNDRLLKPLSEICLPSCIEQNPTPSYSYSSSSSPSGTTVVPEQYSTLPATEELPPLTPEMLQKELHAHAQANSGKAAFSRREPDLEICQKILTRCNGASLPLVRHWLKNELPRAGKFPELSYAWYETMAQVYFDPPKLERVGKSIPAIP